MKKFALALAASVAPATPAFAVPPPPPQPPPSDARFRPADETDPAPFLADFASRFTERRVQGNSIEYLAQPRTWVGGVCYQEALQLSFWTDAEGQRAIRTVTKAEHYVLEPVGGCASTPQGAQYFDVAGGSAWVLVQVMDQVLNARAPRPTYKLACLYPSLDTSPCQPAAILAAVRRETLRGASLRRESSAPVTSQPNVFTFVFGEGGSEIIVEATTAYIQPPGPEFAGTYKVTTVKVHKAGPGT